MNGNIMDIKYALLHALKLEAAEQTNRSDRYLIRWDMVHPSSDSKNDLSQEYRKDNSRA